ncbi:putative uroporphyrinogen decarboxylase [Mycobacterium xenopi 4042]|uniref:Putative uroporphyrinogen decarboxylase n=1 Tax=Mycobacterium xenopi 4042 TaxID=1299334 RepID=X8CFG8_MYCXE|nr:putative uroporphyrinogen decarboxylase [Mycobacterium xenopi 4042]
MVGVDWRTALTDAAGRVQPGTALQGNLDPRCCWRVGGGGARGTRRGRRRSSRR